MALSSGLSRILQERLETSKNLAMLEQEVEDFNALLVASAPDLVTSCSTRRLICLPLDERFDPPMGVFSHGHVQTGDKISVPRVFWQAIQVSQAEVCRRFLPVHLLVNPRFLTLLCRFPG